MRVVRCIFRGFATCGRTRIRPILGIDQRVYSNYETGKREIPVRCLMALADYYGTTLDYLTGRTRERRPR